MLKNYKFNLKQTLKNLGVEQVYFCSGARNASLLNEFAEFEVTHMFQEEQASFMALGSCKITDKPVVVCTTSGTAVAQCLPAVIEAYHTHQKLIIISADRPLRLKGSWAPQTIEQTGLFSHFVRTEINSNTEEKNEDIQFPLHINIHIDDASIDIPEATVIDINSQEFWSIYAKAKHPVFLYSDHKVHTELLNFIENSGDDLFAEVLSPKGAKNMATINYEFELVKKLKEHTFDLVVKIGPTPISKVWRLLDNTFPDIPIVSLSVDPVGLGRGFRLKETLKDFPQINQKKNGKVGETFELGELCQKFPLSEFSFHQKIYQSVGKQDLIFLGNSMPIRYADFFKNRQNEFFASRGASGIDGQIATAIGMARQTTRMVHLIIGDLTFLYDFSSLINLLPPNLKIHVINNRGGRIFERIKMPKEILNVHDLPLEKYIHELPCRNQITVYTCDNEQTRRAWESL